MSGSSFTSFDFLFQSTHPIRDATVIPFNLMLNSMSYFNPRIPLGMRRNFEGYYSDNSDFNPRIPLGMRRLDNHAGPDLVLNFNPRIPLGMRPRYLA